MTPCGKRVRSKPTEPMCNCIQAPGHSGDCRCLCGFSWGGPSLPAPPAPPAPAEGVKYDATKARWDLVPWAGMTEVVHVLTHGAVKYAPDNWKKVPDHRRRYLSAALRHMTAWAMGEIVDTESGRPHLAHAVCCLLFLIEREGEKS